MRRLLVVLALGAASGCAAPPEPPLVATHPIPAVTESVPQVSAPAPATPAPATPAAPVPTQSDREWFATCTYDRTRDQTTCFAQRWSDTGRLAARVWAIRFADGRQVGPLIDVWHDWPGRSVRPTVRVDALAPIQLDIVSAEHGCRLVRQMQTGTTLRVAAAHWPHCTDCRRFEVNLAGFDRAYLALRARAAGGGIFWRCPGDQDARPIGRPVS